MKPISKYSFSLLVLFLSLVAFSQEKDSLYPKKINPYGLRLGVDLQRLTRGLYDKDFDGFEIVADYRLSKKLYLAAEIGKENKTTEETSLNFSTKGNYLKIGLDRNIYENWLNMENLIYFGFRYSISNFSQNLNHYSIYRNTATDGGVLVPGGGPSSNYFENNQVIANKYYGGLNAHWIEIVGGIKAEILDHLFLGFSARLNYLVSDKKPDNFDNLYIPGFNRTYQDSKIGVGFNYSISYFIPLYKK